MKVTSVIVLSMMLFAACDRPIPPPGAAASPHRSLYEMQVGKQVYQAYCVGCHGASGEGDGFNSFNLDPRPRNLTDPAYQKTKSNAELADVIRRGGAGVGQSSLMPPWGNTLDAREVDAVILYVRSLKRATPPNG